MKPTNPMTQLKQWKANDAPKIGPVNQPKIGLVKNPYSLKFEKSPKTGALTKNLVSENLQSESHSEPKKKSQGKLPFNPLVVEYSQITRQFKLIHDSNRKCLEVYPDDFHHKLKMKGECADLVNRLKGGGKLLNDLAKGTNLTQEQTALLKAFKQVNGYLIYKFSEVAEQIDQLNIERVEGQVLQGGDHE